MNLSEGGAMRDYETLDVESKEGVAYVMLNRPSVYNVFDERVVEELTDCFTQVSQNNGIYAAVLTGNGRYFCAGADLNWMQKVATYTKEENIEDSKKMAHMFHTIDSCSKPVVGRINGSAFGGGVGLVAVCDVAVCSENAAFAFSEVNLGIVPAVVSTYVIPKIGVSHARALFVTGKRFGAEEAVHVGLVHKSCPLEGLDDVIHEQLTLLQSSGPNAMRAAKGMIHKWSILPEDVYRNYTTELIADLRASEEGEEGIKAFLEKRKPVWR
jgi:methylglutaconyl-CoA hydratase